MIPRPPRDPRLTMLDVALDGDAMTPVFEAAFFDSGLVRSCRPYYVRYRPGKYVRVQYRLEFADGGGEPAQAHIAMFAPARARKLAVRHGLAGPGSSDAGSRGVFVPSLHAIVQLFPADLALPGLTRAVSPESICTLFSRDLRVGLGGVVDECDIDVVRYKAAKRAVLRYRLAGPQVTSVYGKLRKDGAENLAATGAALRHAGVPTPDTLGWSPEVGMAVQAEAPGTRLAALRHAAEYVDWMPAVAACLAQLHSVRVDGLPHWSLDAEARELQVAAETAAALLPSVAPFATSLAGRLTGALATLDGNIVTTHGSFHDDQVMVGERGVYLIDTDSVMLADGMADVGHNLSYLSAQGSQDAYERFLDEYRSARPSASRSYLIYEAASLLRWATLPFRELRPDWPAAVSSRLHLANTRMTTFTTPHRPPPPPHAW